jgi:hypothetical protein
MAKKSGIGALLGIAVGITQGLLNKKKRDEATPAGAGVLRDIGITTMLATGGSMVAKEQGLIDCTTYGLPEQYCALIHGAALVIGFAVWALGQGKTKKDTDNDSTGNAGV